MNNRQNRYLLLQVNDALFPIGGYSHSYGLETYIQRGLVKDETTARSYIEKKIICSLAPTELLGARLSYEAAKNEDVRALGEMEDLMEASLVPMEVREAQRKLGSRFVKTVSRLNIAWESPVFVQYCESRAGRMISHVCAYGCFAGAVGLGKEEMLETYLYAQTSAMVTNCVKSVPLSQSAGQKILADIAGMFDQVLALVYGWDVDMLCASAPGFDIRCMQHEELYSRIYMS